jgi:hypothetical protein
MGAGRSNEARRGDRRSRDGAVFELERFTWGAPDRLDVAGRFGGLRAAPREAPVLVVRAGDRTHRLPALPEKLSGPPENGQPWRAAFAWQEAPVHFDYAELELGESIVVSLPRPDANGRASSQRSRPGLPGGVRNPDGGLDEEPIHEDGRVDGASRLSLQAQILTAREDIRGLEGAMQQSRDDLARAHEDLENQRQLRAADASRFRDGLAQVQQSAQRVLAEEQAAVEQLRAAYREAIDSSAAKDAALEDLRGTLDAVANQRAEVESEYRAELARLTERVAELEAADDAAERKVARFRAEADAARSALAAASEATEAARVDAERLLARLTMIRDSTASGAEG